MRAADAAGGKDGETAGARGVNEHYVPCRLRAADSGPLSGLVPVRPLALAEDGLLVERIG